MPASVLTQGVGKIRSEAAAGLQELSSHSLQGEQDHSICGLHTKALEVMLRGHLCYGTQCTHDSDLLVPSHHPLVSHKAKALSTANNGRVLNRAHDRKWKSWGPGNACSTHSIAIIL